jgi:hypothetical protein
MGKRHSKAKRSSNQPADESRQPKTRSPPPPSPAPLDDEPVSTPPYVLKSATEGSNGEGTEAAAVSLPLGRYSDFGRIMEYVSNPEALAVAALIYETDKDVVWTLILGQTLFFCWEEWSTRDPTPVPKGPHILRRSTAGIVQRALGRLTAAEVLPLDGRSLNERGVLWLSEALVIRKDLNIVDLSFNALTPTAVRYICECFRASGIEALYLGNNKLGDEGAELIAQLLIENGKIRRLNLSANGITDKGLMAIADALVVRRRNRILESTTPANDEPQDRSELPQEGAEAPEPERCELASLSFTNNKGITTNGIAMFQAKVKMDADFRGCGTESRHGIVYAGQGFV